MVFDGNPIHIVPVILVLYFISHFLYMNLIYTNHISIFQQPEHYWYSKFILKKKLTRKKIEKLSKKINLEIHIQ